MEAGDLFRLFTEVGDANPSDFTFRFGEYDLAVSCRGSHLQHIVGNTGLVPWPGATVMCHYILKNVELFQGKRVLELGCGVGLCGLLASKFTNEMVLTDGDEIVVDALPLNIKKNKEHFKENFVDCQRLWWGNEEDISSSLLQKNKFDVIVAADVIYIRESVGPLFDTVAALLAKENGIFVMSYTPRNVSIRDALAEAEKRNFKYEKIELNNFLDVHQVLINAEFYEFKLQ